MSEKDTANTFAAEMKAWMMIQVIGRTSVNFLNKKKLRKEMEEHLEVLTKALSASDGLSFPEFFIDSCLTSKSYRTAVFGTMSMSDAGAATRLAQDILEVTEKIPDRFELTEAFGPVREAMLQAFRSKVPKADELM